MQLKSFKNASTSSNMQVSGGSFRNTIGVGEVTVLFQNAGGKHQIYLLSHFSL